MPRPKAVRKVTPKAGAGGANTTSVKWEIERGDQLLELVEDLSGTRPDDLIDARRFLARQPLAPLTPVFAVEAIATLRYRMLRGDRHAAETLIQIFLHLAEQPTAVRAQQMDLSTTLKELYQTLLESGLTHEQALRHMQRKGILDAKNFVALELEKTEAGATRDLAPALPTWEAAP